MSKTKLSLKFDHIRPCQTAVFFQEFHNFQEINFHYTRLVVPTIKGKLQKFLLGFSCFPIFISEKYSKFLSVWSIFVQRLFSLLVWLVYSLPSMNIIRKQWCINWASIPIIAKFLSFYDKINLSLHKKIIEEFTPEAISQCGAHGKAWSIQPCHIVTLCSILVALRTAPQI